MLIQYVPIVGCVNIQSQRFVNVLISWHSRFQPKKNIESPHVLKLAHPLSKSSWY